jgi:hypothetical protein
VVCKYRSTQFIDLKRQRGVLFIERFCSYLFDENRVSADSYVDVDVISSYFGLNKEEGKRCYDYIKSTYFIDGDDSYRFCKEDYRFVVRMTSLLSSVYRYEASRGGESFLRGRGGEELCALYPEISEFDKYYGLFKSCIFSESYEGDLKGISGDVILSIRIAKLSLLPVYGANLRVAMAIRTFNDNKDLRDLLLLLSLFAGISGEGGGMLNFDSYIDILIEEYLDE